ncbi:TPA: hypothetical protein ACG3JU_003386 [Clostridioides difficile]|uniref:hypothetical protein n=1 Tax=Clostridioides difficile TaxID=1496 RepID=UPI0009403E61|nr:hypothetical protein [Clostridioides difficile]QVW56699.1 hypothetical protein [Clostridioides phage phiCD08011]MDE3652395.1 hypothetical protein [Clostridioides difficile]HBE8953835.1 hypothetical protein [Clostridioides difficile]HBF7205502.1 hypothetical protein [Clostridioides difficile]HBF7378402.1 hypothetical protein [Clostridioides difficile]
MKKFISILVLIVLISTFINYKTDKIEENMEIGDLQGCYIEHPTKQGIDNCNIAYLKKATKFVDNLKVK